MLEEDKPCYTLNSDGTFEKWYVSKIESDLVYVRKKKLYKFNDIRKAFPIEDVLPTRKKV